MGIEQRHEDAVAGFQMLLRADGLEAFLIWQVAVLAGIKLKLFFSDDIAVLVIEERHALGAAQLQQEIIFRVHVQWRHVVG